MSKSKTQANIAKSTETELKVRKPWSKPYIIHAEGMKSAELKSGHFADSHSQSVNFGLS